MGADARSAEKVMEIAVASIPSSSISIDISLPLPEMKPQIVALCRDLFKEWSCLDDSSVLIETVSGGFTNLLLKVSVKQDNGDDAFLIVRVYGPGTDSVIDRKRELHAIPYLSAAGFGPKLLGLFGNGIVQSFINARALSSSDIKKPKLAAEIARELRRFHHVDIPGFREPQLWNDIFKFLEKAAVLNFDDSEKQAKYKMISFAELHEEVNALKGLTDQLNAPVIFSHNDLLPGNLLLSEDEEKLYFIDLEYGSYSYRGYDIANHFIEYAGLELDYSMYPDKDIQYHFFRNYLQPDKPQEVPEKDLEVLYVETNTYRLAAHIYWALWGIIQAKISPLDLDYLGYFFHRYNEYKQLKEACFALALDQCT